VEGVHRMESKKEPAAMHIRVVQRLQPSETLAVHLGIQHSERQDHLDIVWEANIAQARCWTGPQQRSRIRPRKVCGKFHSRRTHNYRRNGSTCFCSFREKYRASCRDVIKDEIGGKLPSGRPRASAFTPRPRFYPRTDFYRPRTR
jgi:hypothetical protein